MTIPMTPRTGPRWIAIDTWTITRRALLHWIQRPTPVIVNLLFPIMTVLMFGYLFGGAMTVPGGGDYREFLLPGMFALTMVFGLEGTMVAVTNDATKGVTDRFRSMPMASSAVMAGRAVADMIDSAAVLTVMLICGLLVGWQSHGGLTETAAAIGLLLLLRFALIWAGVWLGLAVGNPESVVAVQILVWPLGFLSSAMVAPSTMPGWLGTIAEWNPLSATATASRDLFGNPGIDDNGSWITDHAVLAAVIWPLLIIAIFAPLSARKYRSLNH